MEKSGKEKAAKRMAHQDWENGIPKSVLLIAPRLRYVRQRAMKMTADDITASVARAIGCPTCMKPMIRLKSGWLCEHPGHSRLIADRIMRDRIVRTADLPFKCPKMFEKWFSQLCRLASRNYQHRPGIDPATKEV